MTTNLFTMAAALLTFLSLAHHADAQNLAGELRSTRWDSRFTFENGTEQRAIVTLAGNTGSYDLVDQNGRVLSTGQLSKLQYFDRDGGGLMTGSWSLGGEAGFFQFNFDGGNTSRFTGGWYTNGAKRSGKWSGRRMIGGGGDANVQPGQVTYGDWQRTDRGNYIRSCTLPGGARQYLCLSPGKPEWVYWYNPATQQFWCACPTTRHPDFGGQIAAGRDLFLMATRKAGTIDDTVFPDNAGANFKQGVSAKDADGTSVPLGCPPTDFPPNF